MIFVTIGVQLPFDRLISAVDQWSAQNKHERIFAQIGNTDFIPKHMEFTSYMNSADAEEMFEKSTVIISHAGMGSILNALKYKKPIIAMPRLADKGEHRNNHQLATARWISGINGISIAWNEDELFDLLTKADTLQPGMSVNEYAPEKLINNVKNFLSS